MSAVSVGALVAAALLVAPAVVGAPAEAAVVKSVKGKNVTSRRIVAPSNNVTEVLLEDGTVITLSPGASIDIVSFTYNGGNDGSLRLKINNGTVRISGGLANNRNTFTIETPQASIALDAGTALVAVSGGETKAHLLNGAGFTFTSNNRSKRIFRPGFKTTSNGGSPTRPARVDQREIQNDLALLKISVVPVRVLPRASAGNNQTANGLPPAGPDDDNITTGSINSSSSQQQQTGDPGLPDEPVNLAATDDEDGTNGFDDPVNVNNPITVEDQTGQVTPVDPTPVAAAPVIVFPTVNFSALADGSNFESNYRTLIQQELSNVPLVDLSANEAYSGATQEIIEDDRSSLPISSLRIFAGDQTNSTNDLFFSTESNNSLDNSISGSLSSNNAESRPEIGFVIRSNARFDDDIVSLVVYDESISSPLFTPDDANNGGKEIGAGLGIYRIVGNTTFSIENEKSGSIFERNQELVDVIVEKEVDANFNPDNNPEAYFGEPDINDFEFVDKGFVNNLENERLVKEARISDKVFVPEIVNIAASAASADFQNSILRADYYTEFDGSVITNTVDVVSNVTMRGKLLYSGASELRYSRLRNYQQDEFYFYGKQFYSELFFDDDSFYFTDFASTETSSNTLSAGATINENRTILATGNLDGAVARLVAAKENAASASVFKSDERVIRYFVTAGLDQVAYSFDSSGTPVLTGTGVSPNPLANGSSILGTNNDLSPLISENVRAFQSFESFEDAPQQSIVDTGLLVVSQEGDAKFQNPNVFAHVDFVINDVGEGENRIQDSSISTTLGQLGYIFSRDDGNEVSLVAPLPEKLQATDSADVFAAGRTIGSSSGDIVNGSREGSVSFTSGIFSTAAGGGNPAAPGDGDLGFLVLENFGDFSSDVTEATLDGKKLSDTLGVPGGVLPGGTSFAVGTETEQDQQYGLLRLATAVGGLNLDLSETGGYDPRSFVTQGVDLVGFANGLVESDQDGQVKISSFYNVTEAVTLDDEPTKTLREHLRDDGITLSTNGIGFNAKGNFTISGADGINNIIGGGVTSHLFGADPIDLGSKSMTQTSQANSAGSVYISNNLFALATQFDVTEFERGGTKNQQNFAFVSSDFVKEGLPSNKSEFNVARTKDYKHVQWGFFFGDAFDSNGDPHHVHMGTFATGSKITAEIAKTGRVQYDGHLIGNVNNAGNTYVAGGTFTDTFDFATRRGETAVQFDGRAFNGVSGSSGSSYASVVTSADNFTGTLSGNFVGGLNSAKTPNGLAGQFAIGNGGNYNAVGTFAADGTVLK